MSFIRKLAILFSALQIKFVRKEYNIMRELKSYIFRNGRYVLTDRAEIIINTIESLEV